MKLINKKSFTIRDFEQGLMLAGYVTPINANEVTEKEMLYEYDKQNIKAKQIIYFKRSVLAAEIINELKDEKTFGRIKFQKMVYLCENVVHMNLSEDRYKKFAAGPFDNRFMHSINKELKEQKWFDVKIIKDGKYSKPLYFELEKKDNYKEYYSAYYSKYDEDIHRIISLLRKQKTDFVELIATIFFSWKEIIDEKQKFTNSLIYNKVYSWSKEKKRFSTDDIDSAIEWMENEKLTPLSI
jgi:hypothetical protein